jgi:single-strand DNA-binding protein
MMNSVNVIGNISTDIDLKATPSGKFVATFNVAVNNPFNREKTSFLPVEVWGKVAQNTADYCKKGSKVGISGHLEVDQWEKDGQKKYKTKIIASMVGFLDSKNSNRTSQNNAQNTNHTSQNDPFPGGEPIDINDEELPF